MCISGLIRFDQLIIFSTHFECRCYSEEAELRRQGYSCQRSVVTVVERTLPEGSVKNDTLALSVCLAIKATVVAIRGMRLFRYPDRVHLYAE